jgi:hypothetical protein
VNRDVPIDATDIRERSMSSPATPNTRRAEPRSAPHTHAGVLPNLGSDVGWWRVNDFWLYAALAFVI